jgi:hypothetical protein
MFATASSEVASSEIPRGKVSELTYHWVSGIREPSVQLWTRKVMSSNPLRSQGKGIAKENCGEKISQ